MSTTSSSGADPQTRKRQLRKKLSALLASLPPARFQDAGRAAIPLLESELCGPVALFASRVAEIDTSPLDDHLFQHGIERWYPAIVGDHLEFRLAQGRMRDWPTDRWGIPIPPDGPTMNLSEAGVILVPGLAFDRSGGRLGYGRGFYDRALGDTHTQRIGLALAEQLVPEVPTEAHDRRIPFLAIPGLGLLTCQQ